MYWYSVPAWHMFSVYCCQTSEEKDGAFHLLLIRQKSSGIFTILPLMNFLSISYCTLYYQELITLDITV